MSQKLIKEQFKYLFAVETSTLDRLENLMLLAYTEDSYVSKTLKEIKTPTFTTKLTGLSPRVLNHWIASGILNIEEAPQGWHRFNLVELTLITILKELREYGMSLEQLEMASASLQDKSLIQVRNKTLSWIELGVLAAMTLENDRFYLAVFPSGYTTIRASRDFINLEMHWDIWQRSFLKICLNTIVGELSKKPEVLNRELPVLMTIDADYREAISEIVNPDPDLKEVTIKFREGHDIVTKHFQFKTAATATNMLSNTKHGEIKLNKADGKIVGASVEIKSKISRKPIKEKP